MTILLINVLGTKREYIIKKFLFMGIETYHCETPAEANKILVSKNISHILIDFESRKFNWLKFLKELRETEDGNNYFVVANSSNNEKPFIVELLKLGIKGFIAGNLRAEKTYDKFITLLKLGRVVPEKRKHFRAKVRDSDNVKINFKVKNIDNVITGIVTDLSVAALAFKLDDKRNLHHLSENSVLDKVQIRIKNKFAIMRLRLIKTGDLNVGLLINPSDNLLNILSGYIYDIMLSNVINSHKELAVNK